jgi:hypothetical protein
MAGRAGDIEMVLVDSTAHPVRPAVALSTNPVLAELLASFSGGNLAVGAGQGVVAVVWLTAHLLNDGDPTGGYALLACP